MIQKIKDFLNTHEDIAQLVKFTLFSLIAFAVEYISFTIVLLCMKSINQETNWFLFHYTTENGGLGGLLAFFISNILAQTVSFIINRKKTFKATNNVVYSATMYAIMVCSIIILNTWLGSALTSLCNKAIDNLVICQYIGKFAGSFAAFVINFLCSKFIIMRSPKKQTDDSSETIVESIGEVVATSDDINGEN